MTSHFFSSLFANKLVMTWKAKRESEGAAEGQCLYFSVHETWSIQCTCMHRRHRTGYVIYAEPLSMNECQRLGVSNDKISTKISRRAKKVGLKLWTPTLKTLKFACFPCELVQVRTKRILSDNNA